jgi:ankyrin repeat protein
MYQTRLACYEHQKAFEIGSLLQDTAGLGRVDVVKYLLAKGADPWIKETRGQSAVERAERHGYTAVARRPAVSWYSVFCPHNDFTRGRRIPGCE